MKYVILEKSRVKSFVRTRRGKLERVSEFERADRGKDFSLLFSYLKLLKKSEIAEVPSAQVRKLFHKYGLIFSGKVFKGLRNDDNDFGHFLRGKYKGWSSFSKSKDVAKGFITSNYQGGMGLSKISDLRSGEIGLIVEHTSDEGLDIDRAIDFLSKDKKFKEKIENELPSFGYEAEVLSKGPSFIEKLYMRPSTLNSLKIKLGSLSKKVEIVKDFSAYSSGDFETELPFLKKEERIKMIEDENKKRMMFVEIDYREKMKARSEDLKKQEKWMSAKDFADQRKYHSEAVQKDTTFMQETVQDRISWYKRMKEKYF